MNHILRIGLLEQPPPADVASVLNAVQSCSHHDESIRRPAEEILQRWENSSGIYATGYMASLLLIIDVGFLSSVAPQAEPSNYENCRLLAAILLKNGIPKCFAQQLDNTNTGDDGSSTMSKDDFNTHANHIQQELAHLRTQLPVLLFNEANPTVALHLQLALSNIALFDFPHVWPTLIEDLMEVASGRKCVLPRISSSDSSPTASSHSYFPMDSCNTTPIHSNATMGGNNGSNIVVTTKILLSRDHTVRLRAVRTMRMCLQSIRHRKIITPKSGKHAMVHDGSPNLIDLRHLGKLIEQAAHERKAVHFRACTILETLANEIVIHAQVAITGNTSMLIRFETDEKTDNHSLWRASSMLAVGCVKCMTELLPMLEVENTHMDSRATFVREFLGKLGQVLQALNAYPIAPPPSSSSFISTNEYFYMMDKLYRATLSCCITSTRTQPILFAAQITHLLPLIVDPILALEENVLQSMPVKRLINMTVFIQTVLMCILYDEKKRVSLKNKNNVLAVLMGRKGGSIENANNNNDDNDDPGLVSAQQTVTAMLTDATIERLIDSLVKKFLLLHTEELQEWENDPESRYETDLAERTSTEADTPRHCGEALLLTLMNRESDQVSQYLLNLTQHVHQQTPLDNASSMLAREACYRALELCRNSMVGGGQRRLDFSDWFRAELNPMIQTELGENSSVYMRVLQARAIQVIQAYSTSLKDDEFRDAFGGIVRLMVGPDLVTALCAARCVSHLALLHIKGGAQESVSLVAVRELSVTALGNAFALANRVESEESLRMVLMCVSSLIEANGVALEPVLQPIAEQLPPLWERARDSVSIHSSLLSVLSHLIMKMGYSTVENPHVQTVLLPLLDYCTDISVVHRAETLLEDGLRLWLVTLVSSRLSTMGQSLTNMLPRLYSIISAGLEPHTSLKVLQFNAILLGQAVIEPIAGVLQEWLIKLTSCIHENRDKKEADEMQDDDNNKAKESETGSIRDAIAALGFSDTLMQLFPDTGYSICSSSITKVIAALPGRQLQAPLLEASFKAIGRMLWLRPNMLDEIFLQDKEQDEKIAVIIDTWIRVVSSASIMVLLSSQAWKLMFIDQKGAALALCSAVCHSPRVAHIAGKEVLEFTQKLFEAESRGNLDLDSLVESMCGTTRQVVGDGPLGDASAQTAAMLKSDSLLVVSLKDAIENAQKAVATISPC